MRWLSFGRAVQNGSGGDGGRWWDEVDKVVVVVGSAFANRRLEGGLGAKTPMAWFRASFEQQDASGVLWDSSPPPLLW